MVRRALVLTLCFVLFTIQPTLGGAVVVTNTFSAAAINISTAVADFYDYTAATTVSWSDSADFDAGTYTATNSTDSPGSVGLDRIGPPGVIAPDPAISWWDTDWTNRRCFALDHAAVGASTVTEYQIRVDFPMADLIATGHLQADLGDLRAIGSDGVNSLPLWPDDTQPDIVWVQMDTITAGTTSDLCLYFGYGPGPATSPANHTEAAVFTYTTAKAIYYTVSDLFTAPGAPINVVSYIDANTVSRSDGTAISLSSAGALGTFDAPGSDAGSVFTVLGPIAAAAIADGGDSLVPISAAGTSFVVPLSRDLQHFSFVAPFGDAIVDLYDGATLVNTFTVTVGTPYTHTIDDISPGNAAIIESDVPVLVTHRSDVAGDAVTLYPAAAGDFSVVRSTDVLVGYAVDTTGMSVADSGGSASTAPGDRGMAITLGGGTVAGGSAADGLLLTADQPIAVVAHDDGDGNESVAVPPRTELGSSYWLATDSQYVAFSCPTVASADVALTIEPPGAAARPVSCSGGPDVAWAVDTADLTVTTAGTRISTDAGAPFFAYYEDLATDDQIGLLGMKQARQYTWPTPTVTAGGDEGLIETTGSWESATFDTGAGSQVFGLVSLGGAAPTGTTLRLQMATAAATTPTDFVGPDGTAGTYFTLASLPAVADFSHDGESMLRVKVELTTTDPTAATPRLDAVSIDHDLIPLDRSLGTAPATPLTTTIDPTVTASYLLRVKTSNAAITGSEATAVYRGAANLVNLSEETVRFVNDSLGVDSVQQSTSRATDPPELFQLGRPHSVVLDHSAVGPGVTQVLFAWQLDYSGAGSIFFETDFAAEVTAP